MSQTLRGAIIGCGFFSQFHIEAWRRIEGVEIAAACDLYLDRARLVAPRVYSDPAELFRSEALDFVDIATRPESHLGLVRLAVEHRVPSICQKPMAPTWEQCILMADIAEKAGVPLMIHENWRWQPWYREANRLIGAGAIGDPVTYRLRAYKQDGGGPEPYPEQPYFRQMPRLLIYETLVHHLDTARFLFGEFRSIFARVRRINPTIVGEDQACLTLEHASGLLGCVDGNRHVATMPAVSPVLGDAAFEGTEARLYLNASGDLYLDEQPVWKNRVTQGYRGDSVLATQAHFIDCLRKKTDFETSARAYLKTVAAVEAAYRSATGTLT